uniref:Uncharacterized protein n=1 Tax=Lotus japonicus TaxID=34305 RepID=I3SMB3_LOTJA|nr:unknown [Lotus japonicus]
MHTLQKLHLGRSYCRRRIHYGNPYDYSFEYIWSTYISLQAWRASSCLYFCSPGLCSIDQAKS